MHSFLLVLFWITVAHAHNDGALDAALLLEIFGNDTQKKFDQNDETLNDHEVTQSPIAPSSVHIKQSAPANTDTSCTTEDGEIGECVQYYLCDGNNTIIADGLGIIDLRIQGGRCDSYFESCCILGDRRPPDRPIVPIPDEQQELRNGSCGWRNPDGVGFRIKGDYDNEAKFGEFPWMVALLRAGTANINDPEVEKAYLYLGGGSLIHHSVVLTAAHNIANTTSLVARVGEWDTQTANEIFPYQDRYVAEVELHKDFNPANLFYDIALLFLESPVDVAPNVGLACLPQPDARPLMDSRCFASGWGKDKFGKEGNYQVIMKKVDVPAVDHSTCQDRLRRTRLGRFFTLHSSFMCAGGEPGKDTCKGDGGSPLVCPIEHQPNRYHQHGIVAWGIDCGEGGTPGVYVAVAALRTWIDEALVGRGYDTSAYTA